MRQYRCHKVVQAAKIVDWLRDPGDSADYRFQLEGGDQVRLPASRIPAGTEKIIGSYYVVYEDGYTSWSPAATFEAGYAELGVEPTRGDFGKALEWVKSGKRVARAGWNGKGMWLELQRPDAGSKMTLPYLFLNYPADAINTPGARVPWLASQTDMLANDWSVVA